MEPSDRKLTSLACYAFHEAGHAVVARLLGFPVPLVWACPDLGGACHSPGGCVEPGASRAAVYDAVTVLAAGEAAEVVAESLLPDWPAVVRAASLAPPIRERLAGPSWRAAIAADADRAEVASATLALIGRAEAKPPPCDYRQIMDAAARLRPDDQRAARLVPHRWYRLGRRRAERMLAAHLPRLRAVAEALISDGTLGGERVERAMHES